MGEGRRADDDSGGAGAKEGERLLGTSNSTRNLQGSSPAHALAPRQHRQSEGSVAGALKIDNVQELGRGRVENSLDVLLEGLAEEDFVVIAAFEAYGVLAENIDRRDDLHSGIVARYYADMTSGKVSPASDQGMTARRFDELAETLASVRSTEQMKNLLRDLCTVAELDAMGQRLQVAALVNDGVPYQEISRQTGASTATVTRVAHWLRYGEGGYISVLKKVKK